MSVTENIVRTTYDTGNVGTLDATVLVGVPAGSRVIIAVNAPVSGAVTAWAVTDSKGNTYTVRSTENTTPVNWQLALADSTLTTGLVPGDTITVAVTGANPAKWIIHAIAANDTPTFDRTAANHGAGQFASATTDMPAQAQQLVVTVVGFTDADGSTTYTDAQNTTLAKGTASPASLPRSMVLGYGYKTVREARTFSGNMIPPPGWGAIVGVYNRATAPPVVPVACYIYVDATTSVALTDPVWFTG